MLIHLRIYLLIWVISCYDIGINDTLDFYRLIEEYSIKCEIDEITIKKFIECFEGRSSSILFNLNKTSKGYAVNGDNTSFQSKRSTFYKYLTIFFFFCNNVECLGLFSK